MTLDTSRDLNGSHIPFTSASGVKKILETPQIDPNIDYTSLLPAGSTTSKSGFGIYALDYNKDSIINEDDDITGDGLPDYFILREDSTPGTIRLDHVKGSKSILG